MFLDVEWYDIRKRRCFIFESTNYIHYLFTISRLDEPASPRRRECNDDDIDDNDKVLVGDRNQRFFTGEHWTWQHPHQVRLFRLGGERRVSRDFAESRPRF